jgi:hypothetical protein
MIGQARLSTSAEREKLQALFEHVWSQVYRLETKWVLYVSLFKDQATVAVLCDTAPVTFGAIKLLLVDAVFLSMHRLLDTGVSRGRRTASLETLIHSLPPDSAPLRRALQKKLKQLRTDCRDLSLWRHRGIAHHDYGIALDEDPTPPGPVKVSTFTAAFASMAEILTAISDECGLNCGYEPGHEVTDLDVNALVDRLKSWQPMPARIIQP